MINGHCSQCHKAWTLDTEQGLCQWCGKLATCQSQRTQALRSIKSRSKARKEQANHNGNGYDQLEGEWLTSYEVASKFTRKVRAEDRSDLLHDIMLTFAEVKRNNGHKPFTDAVMYRIASHLVANYWRAEYKVSNGLNCGSCSKAQRQRCKENDLYSDCPKAIKAESLSKPIVDGQGNITELGELIADDRAIDLDAWVSSNTWEIGYPKRLVAIAYKLNRGDNLSPTDSQYLWRYRKQSQKRIEGM